jgi:FtsP/CotA-like multicopper oxidase with cupredoxin domain
MSWSSWLPVLLLALGAAHCPLQAAVHEIHLRAVRMTSGQLAYEMVRHLVQDNGKVRDITSMYAQGPTIPGPTIVLQEGDKAKVTLEHGIQGSGDPVSIHVHGVHYKFQSDGTTKALNGVADQAAFPGKPYTYEWDAAQGTAGTWPYHDHAFGDPMVGAEDKGLFGTVIVNPKTGKVPALIDGQITEVDLSKIKREFIVWMHETTMWGQELNHIVHREIPLWTNPMFGAKLGDLVRFHVIGLGTAFHTFHLHGHRWLDPGTQAIVDTVPIGPVSRTSFLVKAGEGVGPGYWHYHCHVVQHMQSGMMGKFRVIP